MYSQSQQCRGTQKTGSCNHTVRIIYILYVHSRVKHRKQQHRTGKRQVLVTTLYVHYYILSVHSRVGQRKQHQACKSRVFCRCQGRGRRRARVFLPAWKVLLTFQRNLSLVLLDSVSVLLRRHGLSSVSRCELSPRFV